MNVNRPGNALSSLTGLLGRALLVAILCPGDARPADLPEDAALTIPREDLFDNFQDALTPETINRVRLYDRRPASWTVIDTTSQWICGPLKTDRVVSEHEIEVRKEAGNKEANKEDTFLKPTEEGGDLTPGTQAAEAEAEAAVQGGHKPRAADLSDEEVQAEIRKAVETGSPVRLPVNPRSPGEPGQSMAVLKLPLPADFDPKSRNCLLHFNRGCFTSIYVNGKKAHSGVSSFCPLTLDITPFVRPGENLVAMLEGGPSLYRGNEVLLTPTMVIRQALITTFTDTNTLELDLTVGNTAAPYAGNLIIRINSFGSQETAYEFRIRADLATGETRLSWKTTLDKPVYWSPDNPHLYEMHFYDERGNALGKERFGFRDLRIRDGHFELNGQRIRLFGNCNVDIGKHGFLSCVDLQAGEHMDTYEKRAFHAFLKGLKLAGVNSNIQYEPCDVGRGYFEACDELGILAYVYFPAWGTRLEQPSQDPATHMAVMSLAGENYLFYRYNHPSFVLISLGAELYKARPDNLTAVYDHLKPKDKQGRPICSSSGRIRVQLNLKQKDTTDLADDHSYWGTLKGPWHWNRGYFNRLRKEVDDVYGKGTKPLTSFECIDTSWRYDCTAVSEGVLRILTGDRVDRAAYARLAEDDFTFGDATMVYKIVLSHGHGVRQHYTDEVYAHTALAETWRRIVEIYRQENVLDGWGPFHIERFILYTFENPNTLARVQKACPKAGKLRAAIDTTQKRFIRLPAYHMVKRCYNPEFLSALWFDRHLIAGKGKIKTTLHLSKDSAGTYSYSGRILFRDPGGKTVDARTVEFGALAAFAHATADYQYDVPAELPPGDYRLELFLFRDGSRVNDNYYPVRVFGPGQVQVAIQSPKAVAVYLGRPPGNAAPKTRAMLDAMGLKYDVVDNLADLTKWPVLILGASSLDDHAVQSGDAVRKWIEAGGRLLVFEQSRLGALPWLPEMRLIQSTPNVSADIVEDKHPAFHGLRQEHFDSWNGKLTPFTHVLDPLNGTVVAAAPAGYVLRPQFLKAALIDVSMNEGIAVASQFDLTERYGDDGVVTILANNLVRYILSDERRFSYTVAGKRSIAVNPKNCRAVNLVKLANAGFRQEEDLAAGEDDAGGKLLGAGDVMKVRDLRSFPTGRRSFLGVPFEVIDPGKEDRNTCVQLDLMGDVSGIPVKQRFSQLFFLHTALQCEAKKGEPAYSFVIRYTDGKKEKLAMRRDLHTCPQPHLDNLPDSCLAWRDPATPQPTVGVYVTDWQNPRPDVEIASIDFIKESPGLPVLIAITGFWDADEHGWK